MKKRIVAILLSLSVFCCSLSCGKRASAAPAVGAIMAIGILAWEIIGVCTGMYDDTAAAIGELIESGVDGFINPDSPFQQNWSAGWNNICRTVEGWFNNGEVQIENGQVKLTYDQYHELYGQVVNVMAKPDVDFQAGFNCMFLDVDLSKPFTGSDLPLINEYLTSPQGQSYGVVYFDDTKMIFSSYYLYFGHSYSDTYSTWLGVSSFFSSYLKQSFFTLSSSTLEGFSDYLSNYPISMLFPSLDRALFAYNIPTQNYEYDSDYCYVYSNGTITYTPLSEVSTAGMKSGLVTTTGAYGDFLKSIKGFSESVTAPSNLDDLSGVLPTEYNPTLSFPVDPNLTRPLPNQITVGNVPGVSDLPLADYQAKLDKDISVPSIISTKFPFCIPFDFMRFLGLLCSDPVAPVFRIPISTNPENLEQWAGNQTVGEYLTPDDPMFEIDEEIVIDLSVIPLVQPVCYTCFIVGFIFLLLHITPKMIQH